jgi:hypothetical protein
MRDNFNKDFHKDMDDIELDFYNLQELFEKVFLMVNVLRKQLKVYLWEELIKNLKLDFL